MVQAWFMDDYSDDQRKPHKKNSSADVTLKELADLGVLYWKVKSSNLRFNYSNALRPQDPQSIEINCIQCLFGLGILFHISIYKSKDQDFRFY